MPSRALTSAWILAVLSALPISAEAQSAGPEATLETLRRACDSDDPQSLVPALETLWRASGNRTTSAEQLAACAEGPGASSRPVLIAAYLERAARADLLRELAARVTSERARLRAAVGLANLEGDYGPLSLAIGRAVGAGLPPAVVRHTLEHLRPPRSAAAAGADARARRSVRAWLAHFSSDAEGAFSSSRR